MAEAASYADIGRMLQNAREDLKVDIKEAARLLHIRAGYLEALESGTPDRLPGSAYARGYLMQYARFLGFNPEEAARAFDSAGIFPPRRFFHIPQHFSKSQRPSLILLAACVGAFIGIATSWNIGQSQGLIALSSVRPMRVEKPALLMPPAACMSRTSEAYPPCYWNRPFAFTFLPNQWMERSLLHIWNRGRA